MIELHTSNTANGQKVVLMLEETGLAYRVREIDLVAGEHLAASFLAINPFGKIPAIVDSDGPGGAPIAISQSLAILRYLAAKSGKFMPEDPRETAMADQFMALVSADIGAAFSGLFTFGILPTMTGGTPIKNAVDYFTEQAHRGLGTLDKRLQESTFLAGERYTTADILAYPVTVTSTKILGDDPLSAYNGISRWVADIAERPAVRRVFA